MHIASTQLDKHISRPKWHLFLNTFSYTYNIQLIIFGGKIKNQKKGKSRVLNILKKSSIIFFCRYQQASGYHNFFEILVYTYTDVQKVVHGRLKFENNSNLIRGNFKMFSAVLNSIFLHMYPPGHFYISLKFLII